MNTLVIDRHGNLVSGAGGSVAELLHARLARFTRGTDSARERMSAAIARACDAHRSEAGNRKSDNVCRDAAREV